MFWLRKLQRWPNHLKERMREQLFKATAFSSVDVGNAGSRKHCVFCAEKDRVGNGGGVMMKVLGCCARFGNAVYVH